MRQGGCKVIWVHKSSLECGDTWVQFLRRLAISWNFILANKGKRYHEFVSFDSLAKTILKDGFWLLVFRRKDLCEAKHDVGVRKMCWKIMIGGVNRTDPKLDLAIWGGIIQTPNCTDPKSDWFPPQLPSPIWGLYNLGSVRFTPQITKSDLRSVQFGVRMIYPSQIAKSDLVSV